MPNAQIRIGCGEKAEQYRTSPTRLDDVQQVHGLGINHCVRKVGNRYLGARMWIWRRRTCTGGAQLDDWSRQGGHDVANLAATQDRVHTGSE